MVSGDRREGAPGRASRSGSERRRQQAILQMRMHEEVRAALEESARRQGFKDTKDLVMARLQSDIAMVRPDLIDIARRAPGRD